jgi:hypothetical protein
MTDKPPPFLLDKRDQPCFKWEKFVFNPLNLTSRRIDAGPYPAYD